MQQRIDDLRFLRTFCRFVDWPRRYLDGCPIVIENHATDPTGLTVVITNSVVAILSIDWTRDGAVLLLGSSLLSPGDLWGLEKTLAIHVERLLRRHKLIDSHGRSTRRRTA